MTNYTGGPAFPETGERGKAAGGEGMTLRDYFAAKALAALIGHEDKDGHNRGKKAVPTLAKWSYEYADAMLEERNK